MYGPTGIGVLYGKRELLEAMPPFLGGGEMIREVTKEKISYNDIPYKFEAGTMPIAQAIGLGEAIKYIEGIGVSRISSHEQEVTRYALEKLRTVPGLRTLGPKERGPLVSLALEGVHPHDLATLLGEENICARAGHHCAMPVHRAYGLPASTRASFGVYTSTADVDKLISSLLRIRERFAKARSRSKVGKR
jgi:cysteine desulfurase/selenocysteine lyase